MVDLDDKKRMQAIAANITKYRKEKGITQKELAKAIGVTPNLITEYIKMRTAPSFGVIQKLADYFGVTKAEIDSVYAEATNTIYDINNSNPDLETALDNAEAFGGKPMSDHDREVIRNLINAVMDGKVELDR